VSVVTFPPNEKALVAAVKSADEIDAMSVTEIERHMREAWSRPPGGAKAGRPPDHGNRPPV
jgi:hypothetical protein